MIRLAAAFLMAMTATAHAQTLDFPSNAALQIEDISPGDSYTLPRDIWDRGEMPTRIVEGRVTRQAWRIGKI